MTFIYYLCIALFMLLCALLCIVVMMQESKASGLGASFGGDTNESVFGTATADVLKKFTGWLGAIFLISCVFLSLWTQALARSSSSSQNTFSIENIQD